MAAAVTATHLAAGHAILFTPDSGPLAGDTFLVVDANGVAGYQASADYVFLLDAGIGLANLSTQDFV